MSKIRLHGSSSGYMEIAPPAAGSSETITLPNSAGEVLLSDGSAASLTQIPAANIVGVCTSGLTKTGGFGKVIQVVTGTSTSAATTASTTFAEITSDLRCTIVPTSANNKIIISASLYFSHDAHVITTRILKDGSTLVSGGSTANTHDGDGSIYVNAFFMIRQNITVEETAGNTNSRYYSPFWNTDTATAYFNRYYANTGYDGTSSMIVMEVAV